MGWCVYCCDNEAIIKPRRVEYGLPLALSGRDVELGDCAICWR